MTASTMGELSEARVGAVRRLIEQVPDRAIRRLETALAGGAREDRSIALVQDLIAAELLERRVRAAVFSPLLPFCSPPPDELPRLVLPANLPALAWRGLKAVDAGSVSRAVRSSVNLRADDEPPPAYDELCARVAEGLIAREAEFEPLVQVLDGRGPNAVVQTVQLLELSPLARSALRRLPTWVRTLSNDYAAAIRLAFRDAEAIADDASPVFMEMLFGHLEPPHQVLRLISLVMDRPSDRYLAASEMASFGERLLKDLDERIEGVRRFNPERGLEGGVALGGSVLTSTSIINEFEQWLSINQEGPWGRRLKACKRSLALAVEARLREVEPAFNAALPSQPMRIAKIRGGPQLNDDPNPVAVRRAQALLAFLYESRTSSNYGGFGAVRAKVLEAMELRVHQYAEDLLDMLHNAEAPPDRLQAYIEITAEFMGLIRDPRSADIIRRRAAVV